MATFAPASASASTQASPMPWPPPVTMAVLPPSLNFSRYIDPLRWPEFLWFGALRPKGVAVSVETVDARGLWRQRNLVAGLQIELADIARGKLPDWAGIDIQEGVAAEM